MNSSPGFCEDVLEHEKVSYHGVENESRANPGKVATMRRWDSQLTDFETSGNISRAASSSLSRCRQLEGRFYCFVQLGAGRKDEAI